MRCLIALCVCAAGWAQSTATIYGTVTDNSGAVMSGVSVSITHVETGLTRQTVTGAEGAHVAVQLPIGAFSLRAQTPGFKEYVQTGIRLQVSENRRADFAMELGQVTERVEVAASVTQVETRTATMEKSWMPAVSRTCL
jgi:hypothetical protein